jgi:hypothetical protein
VQFVVRETGKGGGRGKVRRGKVSRLVLGAVPSWALQRRDVRSVSGQRVAWRSPVAHRVLPAKGVWRAAVKRSPTGFPVFGGCEPWVAADAATRG